MLARHEQSRENKTESWKGQSDYVELLSESTAAADRRLKKQIYQDIFRTPDYFWFDPHNLEFQGFHLVDGVYQDLSPNPQVWLWKILAIAKSLQLLREPLNFGVVFIGSPNHGERGLFDKEVESSCDRYRNTH